METQIVVAVIFAQPDHANTVQQALENAVPVVRNEPGCEQYDLHREANVPHRFVMIERWSDAPSLLQHSKGEAFKTLADILDGRASLEISVLTKIV
ncbi:putative quinol monooxygenase [Burkholderia ubonensis]|uniref:putative quinol monooxygenase n=1 Tax=Burkholderia ubonensis TaxID=101571 RepID=UPI000757CC1F|nr:antibiotic biosynthesis monooxygenase family protein [Burkholderia ubonensis]KVL69813.1 monooxygenase [Burkholderia ubonensis]KVL69986.1 monooxygenase [Burkholderia ubonensis]KVL85164.1 monooxygenase [Burkholderia ubonensis]